MKLPILILIQLIFVLLISLIMYVSYKQKNFSLVFNLGLFILALSLIKLVWFIWMYTQNKEMTLCELVKNIYC